VHGRATSLRDGRPSGLKRTSQLFEKLVFGEPGRCTKLYSADPWRRSHTQKRSDEFSRLRLRPARLRTVCHQADIRAPGLAFERPKALLVASIRKSPSDLAEWESFSSILNLSDEYRCPVTIGRGESRQGFLAVPSRGSVCRGVFAFQRSSVRSVERETDSPSGSKTQRRRHNRHWRVGYSQDGRSS
jgi:hypothetical protein